MKFKTLTLCLVAFALVACETPPKNPEPVAVVPPRVAAAPPPPPAPAPVEVRPASPVEPVPGRYPIVISSPVTASLVVREFIYPSNSLTTGYANLILFARKPVSSKERQIYLTMCEYWKASFPHVAEVNVTDIPPEVKIIPFYWMLKKKLNDYNNCSELVDHYDYARAQVWLTTMKLKVSRNQVICKIPQGFVIMDINNLKQDDDIKLAMNSWRSKMTIVPTVQGIVRVYDLASSVKAVLGALASLVTMKT